MLPDISWRLKSLRAFCDSFRIYGFKLLIFELEVSCICVKISEIRLMAVKKMPRNLVHSKSWPKLPASFRGPAVVNGQIMSLSCDNDLKTDPCSFKSHSIDVCMSPKYKWTSLEFRILKRIFAPRTGQNVTDTGDTSSSAKCDTEIDRKQNGLAWAATGPY